ncbi:MAG: hypothetical protein JWL63_1585 [Rhodocyclales bacterium]|nr:hypothetical protein [Rhodocyclales bacterium]
MLFRAVYVRSLIITASVCFAAAAVAEVYTWKDANGQVHYSDQPPANVEVKPTKPSGAPKYAPAIPEAAASQPRAAEPKTDSKPLAAQSGPKSWQEKDLELKQQRAAQQEAETKRQQEQTKTDEKKRYCDGLRSNIAMFERGGRITSTNPNGERVYLDDTQVKQEADRARGQLARDCK